MSEGFGRKWSNLQLAVLLHDTLQCRACKGQKSFQVGGTFEVTLQDRFPPALEQNKGLNQLELGLKLHAHLQL